MHLACTNSNVMTRICAQCSCWQCKMLFRFVDISSTYNFYAKQYSRPLWNFSVFCYANANCIVCAFSSTHRVLVYTCTRWTKLKCLNMHALLIQLPLKIHRNVSSLQDAIVDIVERRTCIIYIDYNIRTVRYTINMTGKLLTESVEICIFKIGLVNSIVFNKPKLSNDHKQTVASWLDVTSTSLDILITAPLTGPRWWLIFFTYFVLGLWKSQMIYFKYYSHLFTHAKILGTHTKKKNKKWRGRERERERDNKGQIVIVYERMLSITFFCVLIFRNRW